LFEFSRGAGARQKAGPVSCVGAQLNHPARRISLRSASAFLNSTLTWAHASALQRVSNITRRPRWMQSRGYQERASVARGDDRDVTLFETIQAFYQSTSTATISTAASRAIASGWPVHAERCLIGTRIAINLLWPQFAGSATLVRVLAFG